MPIDPATIQWDSAPQAAPTPRAAPPAFIPGTPKPVDPYKGTAEARAQGNYNRDARADGIAAELAEIKLANAQREEREAAAKSEALKGASESASRNLKTVLQKIESIRIDASDNGGWFETGASGAFSRSLPLKGTAGFDLAENLKTIDANSAFASLQAMRDASPTGSALGQITERELDLLKAKVANLNPDQSQDQFLMNLAEAQDFYLGMLEKVDPEGAKEFISTLPTESYYPEDDEEGLSIRVTDDSTYDLGFYDKDGVNLPDDFEGHVYDKDGDPLGLTGRSTDTSPWQGGAPPSGGNVSFEGIPLLEGDYSPSSLARGLAEGAGSIAEGFGDILGIAANPVGQAMLDGLGYDQKYDSGTIIREATGLPKNQNEVSNTIIKGGTAALTGALAARGATSLVAPGGVAQNALATIGRTPIRDTVAGAGAGAGSVLGKASGVPGGEIAGALIGGMAGYGGANALASAATKRAPTELANAAARQGVDMIPADTGRTVPGMITTGAKTSPISASPVRDAAQRGQGQLKDASRRAAGQGGEILESDAAGELIGKAAKDFSKATSQRGERLYDRAGEMAKGVKIKPNQAVEVLDGHIARLSEMPQINKPLVNDLKKLRSDITSTGGVSVTGLKDARSSLSQSVYDGKLRSSQEKALYKQVLATLSDDIEGGLRSVGKEGAANAFKRADAYWKARVQHIDDVLQPILGKNKGGEEVLQAVESMARGQKGGNARLGRLLAEMQPDEAGNIRATIIDRIGKATPGQQTAEGAAFSPATFLTNWNKMTPQAKASLFSDGKQRANLNDIAKLAEGMKSGQAMANHSNTAAAIGSNMGAGIVVGAISPPAVLMGAGAQYVTGKLMASPAFARWLATAPKNPQAGRKWTEQLGIIAGREPLIAADAKALQGYLQQSFQQSPGRIAASEQEQNGRPKPPQ